ncbi:MAG: hypothetical protein RXR51_03040 [Nitrososphaeria archaeon]
MNVNKITLKIKKHTYLTINGQDLKIITTNLDNLVVYTEYLAYALIVVSFVLIIFNFLYVSALLFVIASIVVLFSYYFNKIYLIKSLESQTIKENGTIEMIISKQMVRRFNVKILYLNSEAKHKELNLDMNYKTYLQLEKIVKNYKIKIKREA